MTRSRFGAALEHKLPAPDNRPKHANGAGLGHRETLMDFFLYSQRAAARRFFQAWHGWAIRSRLTPIKRLACTLHDRLQTLLSYCTWPTSNAMTEGLNSKIQWIKYTARGFRSREGFRRGIYFHCGGLSLYPQET
jgi:transposase